LKQCHIPQGLCQELKNFPFASLSPLTTKHCYRYLLTVAPIIDFFICLEVCCHVTSKEVNCQCHCSTVVTSKITLIETSSTGVFVSTHVCVKCAVHLTTASAHTIVARERRIILIYRGSNV